MKHVGNVILVGAGPGDPELLTVKAVKAIAAADVIVYDRLVSDAILALAPVGAARINVGKQPKHHPVPQSEINALLVRLARAGRKVVRLKGGDPFIFGRGSEEILELQRHGIPFIVIPGITSAQGASASLGLPLTHRGLANGVHYITGHCRDGMELDLDWHSLADAQTTLVVYMGMASIGTIVSRLISVGRHADTPVVAINNATLQDEGHLFSTLSQLCAELRSTAFTGPVLFIVGEVVSLHSELAKVRRLAHEMPLATAAL